MNWHSPLVNSQHGFSQARPSAVYLYFLYLQVMRIFTPEKKKGQALSDLTPRGAMNNLVSPRVVDSYVDDFRFCPRVPRKQIFHDMRRRKLVRRDDFYIILAIAVFLESYRKSA